MFFLGALILGLGADEVHDDDAFAVADATVDEVEVVTGGNASSSSSTGGESGDDNASPPPAPPDEATS